MNHPLDNMIWNAICTGNRNLAVIDGDTGYYRPDIAPFAGAKEWNDVNLDKLYESFETGRASFISYSGSLDLDHNKWERLHHFDCCQMVYEGSLENFNAPQTALIVPLSREHVQQMLELTALTRPGPFFENTILFGNYFGIFVNEKLVAMSGQRMHPVPYMEVSAVCTHPDHRGHGYARALMLHVMKLILDNSFTPFLHVLSNNTGAISLYESIGFRVRTNLSIDVVKRL